VSDVAPTKFEVREHRYYGVFVPTLTNIAASIVLHGQRICH
jgi:hypothetical protein